MGSMDLTNHLNTSSFHLSLKTPMYHQSSVFNGQMLSIHGIQSKIRHGSLRAIASRRSSVCIRALSSSNDAQDGNSLPQTSIDQKDPLPAPAQASYYTNINNDYWDLHLGVPKVGDDFGKGWITDSGEEDPLLLAHLLLLSNIASDRAEMHSIISQQRDNWNKLFQSSVTTITMTATLLAAMNGWHSSHSISLGLPAFIMDTLLAAMMVGINIFQPSQLAEEQRTAARLCRKLRNDIEFVLKISPNLRQDAETFVEEIVSRLLAVDAAYPLPLTPIRVERFPKEVKAPILSKHADKQQQEIHESGNGWTPEISENLHKLGHLMSESDINEYVKMAQRVKKINICCSIAAPMFAMLGAALNALDISHALFGYVAFDNAAAFAAVASTMAAFASSFSHDAQLGMIFELYRSSMGYFREVEASIDRAIRLPVSKRENGVIFNQRVAYELGRKPEELPSVPSTQKTAARLF